MASKTDPATVGELPASLCNLGELLRIDGEKPSPHARKTAGELGRRISDFYTQLKYPHGMPRDIAQRAKVRANCDRDLLHVLEQAARACGRAANPTNAPGDPPDAQHFDALAARIEKLAQPPASKRSKASANTKPKPTRNAVVRLPEKLTTSVTTGRPSDVRLDAFKKFVFDRLSRNPAAKPRELRADFLRENSQGTVPPKSTTRSLISKYRKLLRCAK